VTYLIEYLGEFVVIFETVLGYVSGDQMGSFEAKKRSQKSHAWAPLKGQCHKIF
jgi:acyl-CoA-binding protein